MTRCFDPHRSANLKRLAIFVVPVEDDKRLPHGVDTLDGRGGH